MFKIICAKTLQYYNKYAKKILKNYEIFAKYVKQKLMSCINKNDLNNARFLSYIIQPIIINILIYIRSLIIISHYSGDDLESF